MWLNGEVSLELRRGAFHLRPYAGLAWRIRHSGCTYTDSLTSTSQPCSGMDPSEVNKFDKYRKIPYTGVTIGISLM